MPTTRPRMTLQIPGKPAPMKEALTTLCVMLDREAEAKLEREGMDPEVHTAFTSGRAVRVAVHREIARLRKAGVPEH